MDGAVDGVTMEFDRCKAQLGKIDGWIGKHVRFGISETEFGEETNAQSIDKGQ